MRRSRTFIMLGFVLLAVTIVAAVLMLQSAGTSANGPAAAASPTPPPPEEKIVVAAKDIPRGSVILTDSVRIRPWPVNAIPEDALRESDFQSAIGRVARTDILNEQPMLSGVLSTNRADLVGRGSDAALSIPNGMVAMALPLSRLESVGYAIQSGDHIDVLIGYLFLDMDEEFQTRLRNGVEGGTGEAASLTVYGREGTLMGQRVNIIPDKTDQQRPRLVTQMTVQNALVLHVGEYAANEQLGVAVKPSPTPLPQPENGDKKDAPPPPPPRPELVTVAVSPQDALVLKYALESKASLTFALRSPGDTAPIETQSVSLQYMMERFNVNLPSKLPYGFANRLDEIQSVDDTPKQPAAK